MAKIRAHETEASNLLKLNYKINDKLVCYLLDSRATNLFVILKVMERLGMKTKLVANPIMVQLAQGIVKPLFNVVLRVKLFCGGI